MVIPASMRADTPCKLTGCKRPNTVLSESDVLIVPLKCRQIRSGVSISECLCVELCCGSAKFSRALKDLGFAVLPIDWGKNRHLAAVRFLSMDLTSDSAYVLFQQIIDTGSVSYVHAAPPCGTGSRARERPISAELKRQGAPEPKPLRSEAYPSGLPTLTGQDKHRVEAANLIYKFVLWAIYICLDLFILTSAENPKNAYLFLLPGWVELLQDPRVEANDHQVCMFGGLRNKWSRWVATKGLFSSMQITCDGKHTHLPWGFTAEALKPGWNFATAEEAEYPKVLCQRAAQLVHEQVVLSGALPVPGALSDSGFKDRQSKHLNRAATGKLPRGRVLPQLVSEFEFVTEMSSFQASKQLKLLRQYSKRDNDGPKHLKSVFIVGHYREPSVFLECAIQCKHPIDIMQNVDDITKRALFNILTLGPVALTEMRVSVIERLKARALELDSDELALHEGMPEHIRPIMKGKRLLLLQEVMLEAGCVDAGLHDLMVNGTRLTGLATPSGELFRRINPAEITEAELREQAQWHRSAGEMMAKEASNAALVRQQTSDEVRAHWLGGPHTEAELDSSYGTWVSNHRFGIDQGSKTRVIDDCKRGGINLALCTVEKLDLMDIDRIAELCKVILLAEGAGGVLRLTLSTGEVLQGTVHSEWTHVDDGGIDFDGRLLDLKSAYKQLGVHTDSLWASNVHLEGEGNAPTVYYKSFALLFGSTASVYAFNRFARALWKCMTVCLNLLVLQFYDDFPHLEPAQTGEAARKASVDFLEVLGVQLSLGEKDLPFAPCFQPLGVVFDLSGMSSRAEVIISNKPSRVTSICEQLSECVRSNSLVPALASKLHGQLHFTEAQLFGRAALPAIRELSCRSNERGKPHSLTPRLTRALEFLQDHLKTAPPRKLSACDPTCNLLVFTDGSFEDSKGEWGFFIHDCADDSRYVAGGVVPQHLVDYWIATVGEQVITQIELFAVLVARIHLGQRTFGRKVIYWVDNDAARDSLIRGYSPSISSLSVIYQFYEMERHTPSFMWFARVPSASNIADDPSRGRVLETAAAFNAQVVSADMPHTNVQGLLTFEACHKE